VPCVQQGRMIENGERDRVGGVPIFRLWASIKYVLPSAPSGGIPVYGNPEFDQE